MISPIFIYTRVNIYYCEDLGEVQENIVKYRVFLRILCVFLRDPRKCKVLCPWSGEEEKEPGPEDN